MGHGLTEYDSMASAHGREPWHLLAKALPWVDPNGSHDDYLLTVAIREALGEES